QPAPAPQNAFTDAAGKTHTLAEFKGKAVVLNLWATWCGPCVEEMPTLAQLSAAYAGKPVVVIPVSLDRVEDRANAIAFMGQPARPCPSPPNRNANWRAPSSRR